MKKFGRAVHPPMPHVSSAPTDQACSATRPAPRRPSQPGPRRVSGAANPSGHHLASIILDAPRRPADRHSAAFLGVRWSAAAPRPLPNLAASVGPDGSDSELGRRRKQRSRNCASPRNKLGYELVTAAKAQFLPLPRNKA